MAAGRDREWEQLKNVFADINLPRFLDFGYGYGST